MFCTHFLSPHSATASVYSVPHILPIARTSGCDRGNVQIERYNSEVFAFLPDFGYIIGGEDFQSSADFARKSFSTTTCVHRSLAAFQSLVV